MSKLLFAYTGTISTPQVVYNHASGQWDPFDEDTIVTHEHLNPTDTQIEEAHHVDVTNAYMRRTAHLLTH